MWQKKWSGYGRTADYGPAPISITERRVPELIPVLGSQHAGDASHKPGGRLPLLPVRLAVTPATLKARCGIVRCRCKRTGCRGTRGIGHPKCRLCAGRSTACVCTASECAPSRSIHSETCRFLAGDALRTHCRSRRCW